MKKKAAYGTPGGHRLRNYHSVPSRRTVQTVQVYNIVLREIIIRLGNYARPCSRRARVHSSFSLARVPIGAERKASTTFPALWPLFFFFFLIRFIFIIIIVVVVVVNLRSSFVPAVRHGQPPVRPNRPRVDRVVGTRGRSVRIVVRVDAT